MYTGQELVSGRRLGAIRKPVPHVPGVSRVYQPSSYNAPPAQGEIKEDSQVDICDQARLGSCVANSIMEAILMRELAQGVSNATLGSRLWGYLLGRQVEGTVDFDAGTSYHAVFDGLRKLGFPPEHLWPYSDKNTGAEDDPFRVTPPDDVFRQAYDQRVIGNKIAYQFIDPVISAENYVDNVCRAIAIDNYPVPIAVDVDKAFCSSDFDPKISLTAPPDPVGSHALLIVGFETHNGRRRFKIRNSWGKNFGNNGYIWFDESYVASGDLWTVESVPRQIVV